MKQILEEDCLASGQRINFSKSVIFSVPPDLVIESFELFFHIPASTNPGTYTDLGLPSPYERRAKLLFWLIHKAFLSSFQSL